MPLTRRLLRPAVSCGATPVRIRAGTCDDGHACGAIVNAWIDDTPWVPRVHAQEDVIAYFRDAVLAPRTCWVAEGGDDASVRGGTPDGAATEGAILGFLTLDPSDNLVTALYLVPAARGRGLGKVLLDRAKAECPSGLGLWTFVANTGARRFYEREGFREVARTDGDNKEGLPDILFRWHPEVTR